MKKCSFWIVLVLITILPIQALGAELPADGQYMIEVTLSGGSGRATIQSPAKLCVVNRVATATIVWSSPYYDYMLADGIAYYPVNTSGNSTFELPVTLNENVEITARTIAMSEPHEIDYTLYFNSARLKPLGRNGSSPIQPGGVGAAILIIGLAAFFMCKERRRDNRT